MVDLSASTELIYKMIIIGDSKVGKTCLIFRLVEDKFLDKYTKTVGIDYKMYPTEHDGHKIKLQVWDSAGEKRFRVLINSYYEKVHCILVCYDITDRASFDSTRAWVEEARKNGGQNAGIILVGLKTDLEADRKVPFQEAMTFAESLRVSVFELSAKTSEASEIEQPFLTALDIMKDVKQQKDAELEKKKAANMAATSSADKGKRKEKDKDNIAVFSPSEDEDEKLTPEQREERYRRKLITGQELLKYRKNGAPQKRRVFVTEDLKIIRWQDTKKDNPKDSALSANIKDVVAGQTTTNFHYSGRAFRSNYSFSVIFKDGETLDCELETIKDKTDLIKCFKWLATKTATS